MTKEAFGTRRVKTNHVVSAIGVSDKPDRHEPTRKAQKVRRSLGISNAESEAIILLSRQRNPTALISISTYSDASSLKQNAGF